MKSVITFNEGLAVIHAYLCADGYLCKRSERNRWYRFGLRNTNFTLLKDYQKRVKNYFGVEPHITDGRCDFTCKPAYLFLVKNFKSFHCYEWKFPKQMPNKYYPIWLRAFFDCEAWITKIKAKDRSVSLECVNKTGIFSIKQALKKLNIKSKVSKRNTRNIFTINIYGKKEIIKFQKKINFLHPEKKENLQKSIDTFVNYCWKFPTNTNLLKKFVKEKMIEKTIIDKFGRIRFCSNRKINLTKLSKYLKQFYSIKSKVSLPRYNGLGTKFYELSLEQKSEVQKVIDNELIKP